MTTFMILLRGVNVVGRNMVPMAELRAACAKAGFTDVRTYLNSGNIVFNAPGKAATVEATVESILATRFGVTVPVIVRTSKQWPAYVASYPFPDAQPKFLHLCLSQTAPKPGADAALLERAAGGERIALRGDALWIDYASGVGKSKVTPGHIDKAMGSPTTARNWNTVQALAELAGVEAPVR